MRTTLLLVSAFATLLSNAQVPSYVPTDGLVGWWPFNGNANDESGNGHNGSVNGATLSPDRDGALNSAYAFNGSSNNIFVSPIPALTTSGNMGVTIACWVNTNTFSQTNTDLFDLRSNDNSSLQILINNLGPGVVQIQNYDAPNSGGFLPLFSEQTIGTNEWAHLAVSQNNITNVTRLYINGQLTDTVVFPVVQLFAPKFTIASRNDFSGVQSSFYSGALDDFGIWDRALDPNEVTALYSAQVTQCLSTTPVSFSGLDASYTTGDDAALLTGSPEGGVFIGPGVSADTFDPEAAGLGTHSIMYVYVDENGCVNSAGLCTSVDQGVGLWEGSTPIDGGLRLFPNPNQGHFNLEVDLTGLVALQVLDMGGRIIFNEVFEANGAKSQRVLNLSAASPGAYSLRIQHKGSTVTQQFVIE